jgi:surfactin synthase thioesterase subunit
VTDMTGTGADFAVPSVEGSPWVRRLQRSDRGVRLLCFPHAGGAATYYAPLARALGGAGDVDVLALQYPGRQERLGERCIDSIDALVDAVVPELDGWLDRPFALFGHSMGAIVAYEVARILEVERGLVPRGLFVSGRRAPSTYRVENVHRGGNPSLLREIVRLGGTPPQLLDDEDVRQMMLPALRGDYKAIETYEWRPGQPLSSPICAYYGLADPLTTTAEAAAWSSHTAAAFTLHAFPGTHFYLSTQTPHLAPLITQHLAAPPS